MFLALREIRRAKVRFGLLTLAIALLVFLILFQLTIQNGLIRSFVGGIRSQSAPVVVFNVDGRRTLQASTITPDLAQQVRAVDGVAATAPLWASTFQVRAGDATEATAVVAYGDADLGGITSLGDGRLPEAPGEVLANAADADRGYGLGEVVVLEPDGPELTVVGVAEGIGINVSPTLFTTPDTYLSALGSRNPDAGELPPPNVLGVRPASGVSDGELVRRINAADPVLDALTRGEAADRNPGVASIRQSFTIIFVLFALVVPLVTGLFFLIVTFQKAGSLTLLRAMGARSRGLVAALLVQVALVLGVGIAVALALYTPLASIRFSSVPLRFETTAVVFWVLLIAGLGVLSSLAAVRRVLAIDPIEATTASGVRQ